MATLLAITVLLPLLGSLILVFAPRLDRSTARSIALGCTLVTLALQPDSARGLSDRSAGPAIRIRPQRGRTAWAGLPGRTFGSHWAWTGSRLWLFLLTSLLMITAMLSSWESITERAALYYAFLLAARNRPARAVRQSRRRALLHLL